VWKPILALLAAPLLLGVVAGCGIQGGSGLCRAGVGGEMGSPQARYLTPGMLFPSDKVLFTACQNVKEVIILNEGN